MKRLLALALALLPALAQVYWPTGAGVLVGQ